MHKIYSSQTTKECFTIDDQHARTYDAGWSVDKTDRGYIINMHITDPRQLVPIGSKTDKIAIEKARNIFSSSTGISTMLPRYISQKLSLAKGVEIPTIIISLPVYNDNSIGEISINTQNSRSTSQMTYKDADKLQKTEELKYMSKVWGILYKYMVENNRYNVMRTFHNGYIKYPNQPIICFDQNKPISKSEIITTDLTHIFGMVIASTLHDKNPSGHAIYRSCKIERGFEIYDKIATEIASIIQYIKSNSKINKQLLENFSNQINTKVSFQVNNTIEPEQHMQMGELYTRVSHPIRRYTCLAILDILRGHKYTTSQLEKICVYANKKEKCTIGNNKYISEKDITPDPSYPKIYPKNPNYKGYRKRKQKTVKKYTRSK